MTLSNDPSAPLVAVVGATGYQGGSVVANLIESDQPYRLRGLTRDGSKPAAVKLKERGVEIFVVDIVVGNEAAVRDAFRGADVVFAVTNFWEHTNSAREVVEGKLMVDAAKAAGAKLLVWSGLEDNAKGTNGAKTHVAHFDGKAAVTAYAFTQLPTVDVQAGLYMTNVGGPPFPSRRRADGSYVWDYPLAGDPRAFPLIDAARDYGLFVRHAIEAPAFRAGGKAIYTYGEFLSHAQAAAVIERGASPSPLPRPSD
ncbi:NAD(P)-binding protein [Auricularia subglabra TFB-10046 SS5]|nr:NAD(P)-binding protein [Auricularia subglabra TFB-10046 SS5]